MFAGKIISPPFFWMLNNLLLFDRKKSSITRIVSEEIRFAWRENIDWMEKRFCWFKVLLFVDEAPTKDFEIRLRHTCLLETTRTNSTISIELDQFFFVKMCNEVLPFSGIACLCLIVHCSDLFAITLKRQIEKSLESGYYRFAPICEWRSPERKRNLFAHPFFAQKEPEKLLETSETNMTHRTHFDEFLKLFVHRRFTSRFIFHNPKLNKPLRQHSLSGELILLMDVLNSVNRNHFPTIYESFETRDVHS